jgi:hypothetical protein
MGKQLQKLTDVRNEIGSILFSEYDHKNKTSLPKANATLQKIAMQHEFIQDLEMLGTDAGICRLEKETLGEMIKSLDLVLNRLRPVIERVG